SSRSSSAPIRWISPGATRASGICLLLVALIGCRQSTREPVTLRYPHFPMARPDELSKMEALSQQFTQETGVRLRNIPTPESTLDYLELSRKLLRDGSSGADLLSIDLIWSPILEPDLIDLQPYLPDEISLLEPQLLPSYTVNGKLVAVPDNVPIGTLE